jgi:hypothetical protein
MSNYFIRFLNNRLHKILKFKKQFSNQWKNKIIRFPHLNNNKMIIFSLRPESIYQLRARKI